MPDMSMSVDLHVVVRGQLDRVGLLLPPLGRFCVTVLI